MEIKKNLANVMAITIVASSAAPVMAATTTNNETIIGKNRIETAIKISKDGWSSAETVILVNSSAIPDALTATPLAHAKNAPILLTDKDKLNKETADEIKRLGAKNVIIIGGDAVLSSKVEEELKALKLDIDRIKGATREETALSIAKRLDGIKDVSEIAVVNGTTGLADAVSVAAVAAEKGMPIILVNPKKGLAASAKFIKDEGIKASFIIGGKTVLADKLVSSLPGKYRIEGSDRNDTNAKVIAKFYADRNLDNLYLAKDGRGGDNQLIDALAVGALAAKNGAPVLIASKKLNSAQINVINTKKVDTITQVGGKGNEGAFNHLKDIEKVEVIKVKNEAELQEALKKANANDVIEIESSANISKDVTLSTNNAIEIEVKGDLTGEVTVKAPNADIKNSGTIGTLVVENGKNTTVTNTSSGKIDKVEVSSSSSNVKVENNGKIDKVENNASGTTIENNGTISKPVTGTEKPSVEGNKPGSGTTTGGGSSSSGGVVTPSVTYHDVSTEKELIDAIAKVKKDEVIRLKGDIIVEKELMLSPSGETTIDLNRFTLTSNDDSDVFEYVKNNEVLTLKNGNIITTQIKEGANLKDAFIVVEPGGTVNLDNVKYTTGGSGIYLRGNKATANVTNKSIINSKGYCLSTNAEGPENYNVIFNLKDSTFNGGKDGSGTAILVNVPCELNIDNCTVQGYLHGVVVRGGTAKISNSTIINTCNANQSDDLKYFDNKDWLNGNYVHLGALVIGNKFTGNDSRKNAYNYPSNVTLTNNTKIIAENDGINCPAIYMWGNSDTGKGATLNYDNTTSITGDVILGNDKCTINGVQGPIPKPVEPEKPETTK